MFKSHEQWTVAKNNEEKKQFVPIGTKTQDCMMYSSLSDTVFILKLLIIPLYLNSKSCFNNTIYYCKVNRLRDTLRRATSFNRVAVEA